MRDKGVCDQVVCGGGGGGGVGGGGGDEEEEATRRRRRRGGGSGIQNQKQEPHTKMSGKTVRSLNPHQITSQLGCPKPFMPTHPPKILPEDLVL